MPSHLFRASCVALVATAMSFAIRGDIMGDFESVFSLSKVEVGWIAGAAFWGFGISILFGGPLVDALGMRRLATLAAAGHIGGVLLTIFTPNFVTLFAATLLIGIAGTILGNDFGLGVAGAANRWQLIPLPSDMYFISYLPFTLDVSGVVGVNVVAIFLSVVATWYPARVASRLEGANKAYDTFLMVSEWTVSRLGDEFDVRELDRIAVKGKDEPVTVFEVLDIKGVTDPAWLARARKFEEGLALYRARDFKAAREVFAANEGDGPSAVYVERCDLFMAEPPGADWDGVWRMKEK
jgi:hypothetical protein